MRLAFGMRTADRSPKRNYLRQTLEHFQRAGGDLERLHLSVTAPSDLWIMNTSLQGLPPVRMYLPTRRLGANENGLAAIEYCLKDDPEMVVILEDDLNFCADFTGSLSRWLDRHATRERHVYRCFGFTQVPRSKPAAYDWPLAGLRASQTIILWADEAQDFLAWGRAHLKTWVPLSPWGRGHVKVTDPTIAFDKFVATWALLRWPGVPSVISHPYFVNHIGEESSLHRFGLLNRIGFAGPNWAYREASA